jgi:hypothetical protein
MAGRRRKTGCRRLAPGACAHAQGGSRALVQGTTAHAHSTRRHVVQRGDDTA